MTGDTTLRAERYPIALERDRSSRRPVIEVAVEPKTKADQEKMGMALAQAGAGRSYVQRPHG